MHLRPLLAISAIVIFISCSSSSSNNNAATGTADNEKFSEKKIMGTYSGDFEKGIIRIVINYASNGHLSGYNIHKGKRRNLNGSLNQVEGAVSMLLKEPGDDPFDGIFNLSLDTAKGTVFGTWTAFDSSKLGSKRIALKRIPDEDSKEAKLHYDVWASSFNLDSTLTFSEDGTCLFEFYPQPQDSLSQLISIRGNYTKVKDVYTVEWEKNPYTSGQIMKLEIVSRKYISGGEEYEEQTLKGGGWTFIRYED